MYPALFRPLILTNRVPLNRDGQVRRTSGSDALPLLRLIWSVTMGFDIKNLFERKITMKKTLAKILALALCAVLLVTGTVFVTLAFLQDQTQVLKNAFTSTDVQIKLDESKLNADGLTVSNERVPEQENDYRLLPGKTYTKDPKITVLANSEECYVFFAMKNTMFPEGNPVETQETTDANYVSIVEQIEANGWKPFANDSLRAFDLRPTVLESAGLTQSWADGDYMIYYYNLPVDTSDGNEVVLPIFSEFTVDANLTEGIKTWNDINENEVKEEGEEFVIEIIAFAVQTEGFTDAELDTKGNAENAFLSTFGVLEQGDT